MPTPPKKINVRDLVDMREKGLSYNQLSKLFNASVPTIIKRLKTYYAEIEAKKPVGEAEEKADNIKEPTRPWEPDHNPWSLQMLSLQKTRPGYRVKWFRNNPENIEKRELQGWKIASRKDYGLKAELLGEKGQLDTTVRRRELILMELPEELKKQRDAFIRHKTDRQTAQKSADALRQHQELRNAGLDMHLTVEKDTLEDERMWYKRKQIVNEGD